MRGGNITKGIGELTPEVWRAMMVATDFIGENKQALERAITKANDRLADTGIFLAEIIDSSRIVELDESGEPLPPDDDVYRWKYAWKEVEPADPAPTDTHGGLDDVRYAFVDVADGFKSTVDEDDFVHYALNTIEAGNKDGKSGPGVVYTGLDSQGFSNLRPRPIGKAYSGVDGDGDELTMVDVAVIVPMFYMFDPSGAVRYFFSATNVIDGLWCKNT